MKMFHFFRRGTNGKQTYGSEYYVMSESLESAKKHVENSEDWKTVGEDWEYVTYEIFDEGDVHYSEVG